MSASFFLTFLWMFFGGPNQNIQSNIVSNRLYCLWSLWTAIPTWILEFSQIGKKNPKYVIVTPDHSGIHFRHIGASVEFVEGWMVIVSEPMLFFVRPRVPRGSILTRNHVIWQQLWDLKCSLFAKGRMFLIGFRTASGKNNYVRSQSCM